MPETTSTVTPQQADQVAAEIAAMAPELLEGVNAAFADSVLLIGRVLGDRGEGTAAQLVAVDPHGVDIVVTDPSGEHRRRVDFVDEVVDAAQVTAELLALVTLARQRSCEEGTTSGELVAQEATTIRTFLTSVVSVEDLHPHLRQITFGGGDLATFSPLGPDTFLYLLLPPPGRTELTIDQGFTWSGYELMPEADRPVGAYYTLRRWRPDQQELDIL